MEYNLTSELSELLKFVAGVGTAARLYSAYGSEFVHPQASTNTQVEYIPNKNFISRILGKKNVRTVSTTPGKDMVVMSLESSQDLMWITDTIHNFDSLAEAIKSGNREHINQVCDRFLQYFDRIKNIEEFPHSHSKGSPVETFSKDQVKSLIDFDIAVNAIQSIKLKTKMQAEVKEYGI